jgi:hypothetical protein
MYRIFPVSNRGQNSFIKGMDKIASHQKLNVSPADVLLKQTDKKVEVKK